MPRESSYTASEAARALGITLDTLRRWAREGRIRTRRDKANRRVVPAAEIDRLRATAEPAVPSARNNFRGAARDVQIYAPLGPVETEVTQPARVIALFTRESAPHLAL